MQSFGFSPLGIIECTYVVFFKREQSRRTSFKSPIVKGMIGVALPLYLDVLTIGFTLVRAQYLGVWFVSIPKVAVLAIALGILGLICLYLGSGRRYDKLVKTYETMSPEGSRRVRRIAFGYVVGSAALFFLMGVLYWRPRG